MRQQGRRNRQRLLEQKSTYQNQPPRKMNKTHRFRKSQRCISKKTCLSSGRRHQGKHCMQRIRRLRKSQFRKRYRLVIDHNTLLYTGKCCDHQALDYQGDK